MSTTDFLKKLEENGTRLTAVDGKLKINWAAGSKNAELYTQIVEMKDVLIAHLTALLEAGEQALVEGEEPAALCAQCSKMVAYYSEEEGEAFCTAHRFALTLSLRARVPGLALLTQRAFFLQDMQMIMRELQRSCGPIVLDLKLTRTASGVEELRTIVLGIPGRVWVLDLRELAVLPTEELQERWLGALRELFGLPGMIWVGYDLAPAFCFLAQTWEIYLPAVYDIRLAEQLIYEAAGDEWCFSLSAIGARHQLTPDPEVRDLASDLDQPPEELLDPTAQEGLSYRLSVVWLIWLVYQQQCCHFRCEGQEETMELENLALPPIALMGTRALRARSSQLAVASGRLIYDDPDLHQFTSNVGTLPYVAPAGRQLLRGRLPWIELSILADASEDPELLAAFADGTDLERYQHKQHLYSLEGVSRWQQRLGEQVAREGYAESLGGRRRSLWSDEQLDDPGSRPLIASQVSRQVIEGTNADIVKRLLSLLHIRLPRSVQILLALPDEVILECPDVCLLQVEQLLQQALTEASRYYLRLVKLPTPLVERG